MEKTNDKLENIRLTFSRCTNRHVDPLFVSGISEGRTFESARILDNRDSLRRRSTKTIPAERFQKLAALRTWDSPRLEGGFVSLTVSVSLWRGGGGEEGYQKLPLSVPYLPASRSFISRFPPLIVLLPSPVMHILFIQLRRPKAFLRFPLFSALLLLLTSFDSLSDNIS